MTVLVNELPRPGAGREIDPIRALLHDLRQPLAAILMLAGSVGGDVGRRMGGISDQAQWLAQLVETVLSDASSDEVVLTDVAELVASAVARARHTARCDIELDSGPAETRVRPVALGRAVSCVLDNAIRAAGDDGHVVVTAGSYRDGVQVTVTDDGPGFGKMAARTSLGLTTTRAMVAACEGTFHLYSREDGGVAAVICVDSVDVESAS